MGGQAAKQRRKLERLSKQPSDGGGGGKSGKSPNKVPVRKAKPTKFARPITKEGRPPKNNNRGGGGDKVKKPSWKGKNAQGKERTSKPKAKKEKSFKKPKHLKRKLEQAADSNQKEEIATQLEELHRKKNLFSKQQPPTMDIQATKAPVQSTKPVVAKNKPRQITKQQQNVSNVTANAGAVTPPILSEEEEEKRMKPQSPEQSPKSVEKEKETKPKYPKKSSDTVVSTMKPASVDKDGSDDDDSASDDDDEAASPMKRQRGQRRRGRKDTESQIQEETTTKEGDTAITDTSDPEKRRRGGDPDDSRRCIGRKPVTDFEIGKRYEGTIVYVKDFGVFVDIMCHSEAFCHVSRVQDGFVQSPHDILKEGDVVQARVVEIDRPMKRITVSLQSDARMEDEMKSVKARQDRAQKRKQKSKNSRKSMIPRDAPKTVVADATPAVPARTPVAPAVVDEPHVDEPQTETTTNTLVDANGNYLKPESEMTPAELKRARKLARRAQRRAQAVSD